MKYLFNHQKFIEKTLKGKRLFLFLDFDGTLAPIAPKPEDACLSDVTKQLLKTLSNFFHVKLAFISGRAVKDLQRKIGLKNVIYSGNHGLELLGEKSKSCALISDDFVKSLKQIKRSLDNSLGNIKGILIEDKKLSLSVHYRLVSGNDTLNLIKSFYKIMEPYKNNIKIKSGKKVFEIRPNVEWNKGQMALWLLKKEKNIFPIYIGDDETDEDAFKVLKDKGLTVFVQGERNKSTADYYLKNQNEVCQFLQVITV